MRAFAAVLFVSGMATGCGDGGSPTSPSRPVDPIALSVTCPQGVTTATAASTATVSFPAPTTTGGQTPVAVTCSPVSGSSFPIGTTTVACQAQDARNASAACSFPVVVNRIPTLARTQFLAFGDSTTAGEVTFPVTTSMWGTGQTWGRLVLLPTASYPTQLTSLLTARYVTQASDIRVVNSGVSGEAASEGGIRRFQTVMASVRPDAVLLLEGYNDLNLYGNLGVSRGIAGVDTMAREARNRGARVFLATLTPSRPGGRNTIDPALLDAFNTRLRTLAASENAVLVDLHAALAPAVTTYIGSDGLHPTEAGYRRMAEEFFAAIRQTLETP